MGDLREALIRIQLTDGLHIAPEDALLDALGYESLDRLPAPDRIRWFHFTRVPRKTTFEDGLLPAGQVLDSVWRALGAVAAELVDPEVWNEFRAVFPRSGSQFARQLAVKQPRDNQGPFAFLVREAGEGTFGDHKDFTAVSEVAEDICRGFMQRTGVDLLAEWHRRTRPCVVVFERPAGDMGRHAVRAALMYASHRLQGREPGLGCNTCFDGGGSPVPGRDIIAISRASRAIGADGSATEAVAGPRLDSMAG